MVNNFYIFVGGAFFVLWVMMLLEWLRETPNKLPVARVVRHLPNPTMDTAAVAHKFRRAEERNTSGGAQESADHRPGGTGSALTGFRT